ncbi:hypothetical protein GS436_15930 [Rhodococcus hoagii]|nr:hypothetical protein [Prescottella equi]
MQSWSDTAVPSVPVRGLPSGSTTPRIGRCGRSLRRDGEDVLCGITPYDATHLGHAATYLTFDLVNRVLRDAGHAVHYVQNVTDVDDPLFERADRDGEDWVVLGMRETALFREDMEALRVLPPQDYIGAVESIGEVVELVEKFVASGAAYVVDDPEYPDVYFRADATAQFGYESGYDRATMDHFLRRARRRSEPARQAGSARCSGVAGAASGRAVVAVAVRPGRPGWHIECAAIALNRIGSGFDIQGGR